MSRTHALIGLPLRPSRVLGLTARGTQATLPSSRIQHHKICTLGIETSCDDTCVSMVETVGGRTTILYQDRIPCPNKKYEGIHPIEAVESHTRNLPGLIYQALKRTASKGPANRYVPSASTAEQPDYRHGEPKFLQRPDLIAVTRGPGMKGCLSVGISAAKALSVALSVPLIGVHHMQAHALTPYMESATQRGPDLKPPRPDYPFLTLLVSGGHTMLLHTTSNVDHRILASTQRGRVEPQEKESPVAIGDMLDKCARAIVPLEAVPQKGESVVYGQLMEDFVRNSKYNGMLHQAYRTPEKRQDEIEVYRSKEGWILPPPLRLTREMKYDFSGLGGMVRSIMQNKPDMSRQERAELAYHTMRLAFEHLASRVILALQEDGKLLANPPKHLVLSGGVASNRFLRKVIEAVLKARGFNDIQLIAPHPKWCTDNAAMIAWTGAEMYEAGWTTDRTFLPKGEWPIEQIMTGADCWVKRRDLSPFDPGYNTNGQQDVTVTPGSTTTPTIAEPVAPQVPADQPVEDRTMPAEAPAEAAAPQVPADRPIEDHTMPATAPANPVTSQVPAVDQAIEELSKPDTVAKPVSQGCQTRNEQQRQAEAEFASLGAKPEEDGIARPDKEQEQVEVAKQKAKEKVAEVAKQKAIEKEAKIAKQKAKEEEAKVAKKKKAEMARQKAIEKEAKEARQRAKVKEARVAKQNAREEKAKIAKQEKAEMAKQKEVEVAKQKEAEVAKQKVEQKEVGTKQANLSDEDRKQYSKQEAQQPLRGPGTFSVRKVSTGPRGSTRLDPNSEGTGGRTTTLPPRRIDRGSPLAGLDKVTPVHIVRRLRPLQPAAEADKPTTKSAVGPLQKGLSTLKKWVGL